jgi:hypothetical protein
VTRAVIGLGVGSTSVRAVLVRNGTIIWRTTRTWGPGVPLEDAVKEVLEECRGRGWSRPTVTAALGPAFSQFRPLHGLPQGVAALTASQLIKANPDRFFVGAVGAIHVTAASASDGRLWGGALDASIVAAIARGCVVAGHRIAGCAPTVALLGAQLSNGVLEWRDGSHAVTAAYVAGMPTRIRRDRSSGEDSLREEAESDYADAIAAATSAASPFLFDPLAANRVRRVRRALRSTLAVSFGFAVLASVLGPGLRAQRRAARAAEAYSLISNEAAVAARRQEQVRMDDEARASVADFLGAARPLTALLADLTRAMPESTAIISLRVDGRGVAMVALAPAGAEVVASFAGIRSIERPQIVGAITRERLAERDLQRVALVARFVTSASGRDSVDAP